MAKHKPTVIWPTRKVGTYPQQYVQTEEGGKIKITFCAKPDDCAAVNLSRADARLLARRLEQCLEDTK